MSTNLISVIVGIFIGFVLMGLAVWFMMPKLMLNKYRSKRDYSETLDTLSKALQKKPNWHLLQVTDYQENTSAFGSMERVCSMSVCNPKYAFTILADDANRGVTAFMPLAVGIYENKKGEVYVSQLNVKLLGLMFGGTIAQVMKLAGTDLNDVVTSVSST